MVTSWDDPDVRVEGAEVFYRASALGACTRALAAARQELEGWRGKNPDNIQKAFDKGYEAEPVAEKWLNENGWKTYDSQKVVRLDLTSRLHIIGHIDLMGHINREHGSSVEVGPATIIDVKRQNDDEWKKDSIRGSIFWHKYAWQFSAYSAALNIRQFVVVRVRDDGEVKLEWVEIPYSRQDLLERVLQVEAFARRDLRVTDCDKKDFPCPYWKLLHPGREDVGDVSVEEREDTELGDLILHYRRALDESSGADRVKKDLNARLRQRLGIDANVVGKRIVKELNSGLGIQVSVSETRQRVLPAGTMVRMTPIMGDEDKETASDDG